MTTNTAELFPEVPQDTPQGATRRLTIAVLVSSMLYIAGSVIGTRDYAKIFYGWSRGTVASLVFLEIVVIIVVIAAVGTMVALWLEGYVGEAGDAKARERKVSASLFAIFMLVVSWVSAWLGMQDISQANKAVPINFWLAIPPASALVLVSHPEHRLDKVKCGALSLVIYFITCALKFWSVTRSILQAILLSSALFIENYILYWYIVALVCSFLTDVTDAVIITAEWIVERVTVIGAKLGRDMKTVMRK